MCFEFVPEMFIIQIINFLSWQFLVFVFIGPTVIILNTLFRAVFFDEIGLWIVMTYP